MKKFLNVTVNGTVYEVEVNEVGGAAPAAAPKAAPAAAPAPKVKFGRCTGSSYSVLLVLLL